MTDRFTTTICLPHHRLRFDENKFLRLLCFCPLLKKAEKRRVIEAIPRLNQYQVNDLMIIMEGQERLIAMNIEQGIHIEDWARVRATDEREWKELEKEMGD